MRGLAIPAELFDQFSSQARERGEDDFARGRVRITLPGPSSIEADVHGTEEYHVVIGIDEDEIDFSCTCTHYVELDTPCQHIWATLMAASEGGLLRRNGEAARPTPESNSRHPAWRRTLQALRDSAQKELSAGGDVNSAPIPDDRRIAYLIEVPTTAAHAEALRVEVVTQKWRGREALWEKPRAFGYSPKQWLTARDADDRLIAHMLLGADGASASPSGFIPRQFLVGEAAFDSVLKLMCETGRCGARDPQQRDSFLPIVWDGEEPYEFIVEVAPRDDGERVEMRGWFSRGEEKIPLDEPLCIMPSGLLIFEDRISRFSSASKSLLNALLEAPIHAAVTQGDDLLHELSALPRLPKLELHPSMQVEQLNLIPKPVVTFKRPRIAGDEMLLALVSFDYGGRIIAQADQSGALFDPQRRRFMRRRSDDEDRALNRLKAIGVRGAWLGAEPVLQLPARQLHTTVMKLIDEGWDVHAEGAVYRRPGAVRVSVGSGIDWFELSGGVEFEGTLVALPRLLAAVKRGENVVTLDDGSIGLLPMEWLQKYAPIAGIGAEEVNEDDESIRFSRAQIGLLDALLAAMPEATVDESFARARDQLGAFNRVDAVDPPPSFNGTLRPYQRDGLGWLKFLQQFQFGGCLADDMGLGKTVQVLALLETRRILRQTQGDSVGPSLVVVPRSLVFNWKNEVKRFTPSLRVLDHSGINRTRAADHFSQYDLIITTYGTLRRDALFLRNTTFDYVILDEAQAIKNATTEAAKATRLLVAQHRLALSGTPIENRLAELWSLFEFLNPGMLGGLSVFQSLIGNGQELQGRQMLARALRPFILRRTKSQVAKELPEKLEQTIHCDLEPVQRKLYDELREHYRQSLLGQIDKVGLNRSKIQVLEALLRLRQAACHPGLIDQNRVGEPSAKLEALLEHLSDILAEDHKALVFSQFTSLLAIVRKRLDDAGTTYEYLDGKTRDREAKVERFQTDPACKLFLISLKAGGVGLNLTAADYVFLLDPWWNPAVESQAIDRTHRIGQTRRVFAYRLIARDTVEEKVLQLQQTKRDLADAIITADNSVIGSLKREDLELLLS